MSQLLFTWTEHTRWSWSARILDVSPSPSISIKRQRHKRAIEKRWYVDEVFGSGVWGKEYFDTAEEAMVAAEAIALGVMGNLSLTRVTDRFGEDHLFMVRE